MELRTVTGARYPVVLAGVCQGLEGEAEAVAMLVRELAPGRLALGLDPAAATDLDTLQGDGALSPEDEAYARGLGRWGAVELPGPEFRAAADAAADAHASVEGVDLDEMAYLDLFTDEVSVMAMVRRGWRARRMRRRPLKADEPEAFCRAFDARLNRGAFADLERARERAMAEGLARLADETPTLFVCEVQRLDGVTERLVEALGPGAAVRRAR